MGIVIYFIRTRQGYRSLPEAINERYGSMATLAFGLAVLFRLYQEVWSNALVVAGFYGEVVCNLGCLALSIWCLGLSLQPAKHMLAGWDPFQWCTLGLM